MDHAVFIDIAQEIEPQAVGLRVDHLFQFMRVQVTPSGILVSSTSML